MSEVVKERKDIDIKDTWDLSTLFKSDEDFEVALKQFDPKIKDIKKYEGKLNNAHDILAFLKEKNEAGRLVSNLFCYANLRKVEDTRDDKALAMYSKAYGKLVEFQTCLSFANPEILANDDDKLKEIINDEKLKEFNFYLNDLVREKAHLLSNKEETILAAFAEVFNAPEQTMSALTNADMKFDVVKDSEGVMHELNESTYILLQTSKDRTLRKNSFDSFYKTYKNHINTLSTTFSANVKTNVTEAKLRGYKSSREMKMSCDNIPESVYDNLINTVHKRMDLMYRYVKLRKRILKLDELHYYDLYTPLTSGIDTKYSYDEAKQMVIEAVTPLGKEYVARVKKAFEDRWVDVYPNKGKESGAFSSGTFDSNPFIKMNFTGTLDSVSTLAHEMGHSQHSWLTHHNQPFQYADYTMFVAEVASTVNENLLIEKLLKEEKDLDRRLALLNQYLEGFKGTVYRQTMFAEFEKETHSMAKRGEALTAKSLSDKYLDLIKLYFGKDMVIDEEVKYEWARIPHFYYFFYVYVYATGFSSACAISENILSGKKDAVKKYLEFLAMGSSKYPLDELKHAGVDLNTPEPIDIALNKFEKVLIEAEDIASKLGL